MFWNEYGPYILTGFGIGLILILLFIAEAFVVRANRRFLKSSVKEMAELLAMAGRAEEAEGLEAEMKNVLGRELKDGAARIKRRRDIQKRRS